MKAIRITTTIVSCMFAAVLCNAQTRIGTVGTADANAVLDLSSTSKGLMLPRLTTAQINGMATPTGGLVVYNKTTGHFVGFQDTVLMEGLYNPNGFSNMNSGGSISHTFTSTLSAPLHTIKFPLGYAFGSATLTMSIYSGNNYTGTPIATATASVSGPVALVPFSFAGQNLNLVTGQQYTATVVNSTPNQVGISFCNYCTYTTGNWWNYYLQSPGYVNVEIFMGSPGWKQLD